MLKSPSSSSLKSAPKFHLGDKFHKHHKRKASHGDHSDEENRHRKPVKVNGTLHVPHGLVNGRKHKKARHSYGGDAEPNGLVNGMKSSSPGGIKFTALQEQRKQLPIAKGLLIV
jgi:hypothetical protein